MTAPDEARSATADRMELRAVGRVESPLLDRDSAPKQGDEGAPDAWLVLEESVAEAARELEVGQEVLVLTWLHLADRDVLRVHPAVTRAAR